MRLKAFGIGNFPIKITAISTQANAQDSVQKLLFVKVIVLLYIAHRIDRVAITAWLHKTS